MNYAKPQTVYDWNKRVNSESLGTATKHRDDWTDAECERIMDDDVLCTMDFRTNKGAQLSLTRELGRTWDAIKDKRTEIKASFDRALEWMFFEHQGPTIPDMEGYHLVGALDDQTPEFKAAARLACIKLTECSIRTTEEEVGSDEHKYELMSIYSMMGLME